MKLRRYPILLLLIVALCVSVFAQQPTATTSVDRLQQIISYLASDALEGRRTGTKGANDAANYIAGEFSKLGLRAAVLPASSTRARVETLTRYFQPFPYVSSVDLGKGNALSVSKTDTLFELRVGEDWMPLGFSSNTRLGPLPITFAGYGITDAELKYNDYPTTVRDKIAFILSGTPDGDNPHGKFGRYEDVRWKAIAARNAGAKALLVISPEENLKDDRLARLHYDNNGDAGLPVIVISRQAAMRIFGAKSAAELARAEQAERELISDQLKREGSAYGKAALPNAESGPVSNFTLTLSTDVIRRESPSFNVVGILPGSDPKLKDETIVIGAHYDHLGRGGEGSLAPREGEIHHGADDNASGVAGVLELARILSTQNPKPRRTIVFITFSGEEEGLLGSDYYVNHPIVPIAKTVAMINMDMIGRLKDQKLIIGGIGTASEWRAMIDRENSPDSMVVAALNSVTGPPADTNMRVNLDPKVNPVGAPIVVGINGRPVVVAEFPKAPRELPTPFTLTLSEDGYGPSDNSSFYSKQVPVLFFWTGTHDDYHKPSDTSDKINYEGEARIMSFVTRVVRDIDKSDQRPTYTVAKSESQGRSTGFRVYLGTIPNYADTNDGLKLDGVRDDSPAAKAGLKAGDKIVKIAGHDVKNVYDYTYALGEMKAGQEYEVEVIRDGQRLTMKITPEARK